jgi:hypothetical protein
MTTTRRGAPRSLTLMTAALTLLAACLLAPAPARAQWTAPDASGNINNTNTGGVGVGTTTPTFRFEVRGTTSRNTVGFTGDGDAVGYAGIRIGAFTTTGIAANRTSAFNLHMRKDGWYGGDASGPSFIIETVSKGGGFAAPFLITPTNDIILNGGQGASGLSYGRVGVGTTSPLLMFDVRGAAETTFPNNPGLLNLLTTNGQAANMGGGIRFGGNYTGSTPTIFGYVGGVKENGTDNDAAGRLVFGTRPNGAGATDMTRMVIDSAGRVGVGTTSPTSLLHLNGSARTTLSISDSAAAKARLFRTAGTQSDFSHNVNFDGTGWALDDTAAGGSSVSLGTNFIGFNQWTAGAGYRTTATPFYINSLGNVGIGTLAPGYKLDVGGSVNSSGLCLGGDCKTAWSQVGGASQWANGAGSSINYGAGNVGLGTTSPDKLLTVQGQLASVGATMAVFRTTGAYHGNGLALDATGAGNNNLGFLVNGTRKAVVSWDNSRNFLGLLNSAYSEMDFALRLNPDGSLTYHDAVNSAERLRVTAAGSVGIGTAAPERRLHVLGGSIENQWSATAGQGYGFFIARDNNHIAENAYFTGTEWRAMKTGKAAVFQTYTTGGYAFYVQSDDTSRAAETARSFSPVFVIKTDGRVGVGTTAPGQKLDVSGNVNASGLCLAGDCKTAWSQVGGGSQWASGASSSISYASGNVGVGTTNPLAKLSVMGGADTSLIVGDRGLSGSVGLQFLGSGYRHAGLRFDGDGFVVENASNSMTPSTWHVGGQPLNFVVRNGNVGINKTNPTEALDVVGNIKATGSVSATYQDVAEWVPSVQKLQAGTVVVLDTAKSNHVLASAAAYDTKVAGVVSETPGIILGVGGEGKLKVATTGRVKVRADATRGAIHVGDLLVTSGVEGLAMKSVPVDLGGTPIHRPGTIIGKALEPLEKGTGEILVLLSLQ